MGEYRVDADALTALGFSLSDALAAGPSGALATAVDCGSTRVSAALDATSTAFAVGWGDATEAVVALAVGAVQAADVYRESEAAVADAARAGAGS